MCNFGYIQSDKVITKWATKAVIITYLLALAGLVFFAGKCFADEASVYMVGLQYFPQDRFRMSPDNAEVKEYKRFDAIACATVEKKGRSEVKATRYIKSAGQKYALWTVSCPSEEELRWINSMVRQGYIYKQSTISVERVYDGLVGGYKTIAANTEHTPIPKDFFEEVQISSTTGGAKQ